MPDERTEVLSLKVTAKIKRAIETLAAQRTIKSGERHTMTDVIEEAIMALMEREKCE